ncbi:MAG: hypothetical protein ABIJ41_06525 [Candidatus Omnitrophota bacterium]
MILVVLLFFSFSLQAFASPKDSQEYLERQTIFNNVTDFFATIGESKEKRIVIKRAKWLARRKARLKKAREEQRKSEIDVLSISSIINWI